MTRNRLTLKHLSNSDTKVGYLAHRREPAGTIEKPASDRNSGLAFV